MKVIQKGREQTGWSKETKCTGMGNGFGGCGAILLVGENDLYRTTHSLHDGTTDHYNTFRCCECGVETDLPDEDVPSHIRRDLKPRGKK